MSNSKSSGGGINFCGLLAIVFIVLKLCNVIAWSWWLVTAPLWVPFVVAAVLILILLVAGSIVKRIG